jgi:hypothetical protein
MTYRKYQPEDEAQLRQIHAQRGYTFEFPDLSQPEFVSIWVAEEEGQIVSAVMARKTVEIEAVVAQDWSNPAHRLHVLKELQDRGSEDLRSQGFTDMHSWVRGEIRGFANRLRKSLGWLRSVSGECHVKGL